MAPSGATLRGVGHLAAARQGGGCRLGAAAPRARRHTHHRRRVAAAPVRAMRFGNSNRLSPGGRGPSPRLTTDEEEWSSTQHSPEGTTAVSQVKEERETRGRQWRTLRRWSGELLYRYYNWRKVGWAGRGGGGAVGRGGTHYGGPSSKVGMGAPLGGADRWCRARALCPPRLRQDTFSDLQLFLLINMGVFLAGAWLRGNFIRVVDSSVPPAPPADGPGGERAAGERMGRGWRSLAPRSSSRLDCFLLPPLPLPAQARWLTFGMISTTCWLWCWVKTCQSRALVSPAR